jgi:hypothetical protein
MLARSGEITPPYAKQVTMQRDVRKTLILGHFQLNFLCIVSDDGCEILLNSLSGDNANAPTNAQRPAPGSISPSWNTNTDLMSWLSSL